MRTNKDNTTLAQNIFLYFFNRNSISKFKNKNKTNTHIKKKIKYKPHKQKREPFPIKASLASLTLYFLQTSGERPEMPSTGLIRDPHTYSQVILLLSLDLTTIFLHSAAAQYTSFSSV